MDRLSGKRGAGRIGTSRKGHSHFEDTAVSEENRNGQFCNRIGCNGRIKYNPSTKLGTSDKVKYSNPSMGPWKRSNLDSKRKLCPKPNSDSSESSQSSTSESVSSTQSRRRGEVPAKETSVSSNVRSKRIFQHKSASDSSLPGQSNGSLRNPKNNSLSSSVSAVSSSLESEPTKKRSSSRRGNQTNAAAPQIVSYSKQSGSIASAWTRRSISETTRTSRSSQENARKYTETPPNGRSRSFSTSRQSRMRVSWNQQEENSEVSLELERIEQDDDEQVELHSSPNHYDQHHDMRLDIDNMSYEELLALEERMGTVSTALSEEELSSCLQRSTYQPITETCKNGDDTKCSICQEEYQVGDGIGKLVQCHHFYHEPCIHQWLRLKNWCPICKASAHTS